MQGRFIGPRFITAWTSVDLCDMLFKFSPVKCMAREFPPTQGIYTYLVSAFQLAQWLSGFSLLSIWIWSPIKRNECLSAFPCHPTHSVFLLISEAVTLCTVFWVLMLIEVVPERRCTWHVKERVIDNRYKYF